MARPLPATTLVVCLVAALALPARAAQFEHDDCDARFTAFVGSGSYQFSPRLRGELGTVRLFTVLSYEAAAAHRAPGLAFWRLTVKGPDGSGRVVHTAHGTTRLEGASALAESTWDGRDAASRQVAPGRYRYTFEARFVGDREAPSAGAASRYEDLAGAKAAHEAISSTDEIVVDYTLSAAKSEEIRATTAVSTCETQQNAPLEAGLGYSFYYGSTHGHSNFSDGGQPLTGCSSGNAYGSGTFSPTDVYDYAKNAGLDFWLINEHNHLIGDALGSTSGTSIRARFQEGRNAAAAATVDGQFVGLYGMEWGVSSNSDQGHVTLMETPVLFGWEPCTSCNGPSAECSGTSCQFDVFTPKRYGYLKMYEASVANPSPAGALGIFCHPGSGNFDNFAFDANADDAMQGIAVRSGLAFTTGENCSDANVASSDYSGRWKDALNRGFHLGPVADHDSHCNNYGQGIPNRTVYVVPSSAGLTRLSIMQAQRARHFFATEDSNAQLVFAASDGHILGDRFTAASGLTLRAAVYDPSGEGMSRIDVYRGQVGAGVPATPYRTVSGASTLSFTESLTSGDYYYYVHAVQADGHDLWSAPMWITWTPGGGGCTDSTAPAVTITAPASGATVSCSDTTVLVQASDAAGLAGVDVQVDGGPWSPATWDAASGRWQLTWDSSTAASSAHAIVARATDASCGANVGTSAPVSLTVDNSSCGGGGGSAADVSGWTLTQANSTYVYTLPAGTTIPADGYLVVGRNATRAAFEGFWGSLPAGVAYLNSGEKMPIINGAETYTLAAPGGGVEDGPTIAMSGSAGQSVRRNDPCQAAGTSASWTTGATTTGTPGTGAGAGCGTGVVINEFSDAAGTGNYVYEFVELHNDSAAAGDTQAPTTAITAPASGTVVTGTVSVSASATDDVGVSTVEFLLDGVVQSTDTSAPYAWSWPTGTAANGVHALTSRAVDAAGNAATSAGVAVTVSNDTTAPVTSITSPAAGATVSGTLNVTAAATDDVGVVSVSFLLDGVVVATDSTAPWEWSWNASAATPGSHTLASRATDAAGNVGSSAVVSVTAASAVELIGNGGFESTLSPWVKNANFVWASSGTAAQAGTRFVNSANKSGISASIYQQVSVPAAASGNGTFWTHITTNETTTTTAYDKLFVEVRSTGGSLLATLATYSNLNKSTGWVQRTLNLSAYRGQTVRLQFRVTTDASKTSVFRIDSVSLK